MTTIATTTGTIIKSANGYQDRGVYERDGNHFVYTLDQRGNFCFCTGRVSADIDAAWELGYREEIKAGKYQP
jgi:hypothetical protein